MDGKIICLTILASLILSGSPFFNSGSSSIIISNSLNNYDGSIRDYSTYFGNGYIDNIFDSCVDSNGNIIIIGDTKSSYLPTTEGVISEDHNGGYGDVFIAKFDNKCENLLFSTYLGGSDIDWGRGVAVDSDGNIYATGYTISNDFPTSPNAFNDTRNGNNADIFVTKIDPTGSTILYSTYIGGRGDDYVGKIDVDEDGAAYIVGESYYDGYPVNKTYANPSDNKFLVITKFSPDGSFLDFSINVGTGGIQGNDIVVDDNKNTYVTGSVSNYIHVTNDVYDDTYNGYEDVFVMKLNRGGEILFSTYVGGSYIDRGYSIDVDASENIYVTGETLELTVNSSDFPITAGAYKRNIDGGGDAFVFQMDKFGSSLNYSTFLGGESGEVGYCIDIDENKNAYISGKVGSEDYHSTYGSFCNQKNGGIWDTFLTVVNNGGSDLLYSSYLGGTNTDIGSSVQYIGNYSVVLAGYTESRDYPVTKDANQQSSGVMSQPKNGYVTVLNITTVPYPPRNLSYKINGSNILLSWEIPLFHGGSEILRYNIYRSIEIGDFDLIDTIPSKNTSTLIQNHNFKKSARYYVKAENTMGESLPSNILLLNDNKSPEIIEDRTPNVGYTGDLLKFIVDVKDDYIVMDVYLIIRLNGTTVFNGSMDEESHEVWSYSFFVPDLLLPMDYQITAYDHMLNLNRTNYKAIQIIDNDKPIIDVLQQQDYATTGDVFEIKCKLYDNIKIVSASFEARGIEHQYVYDQMEYQGNRLWVGRLTLSSNNLNDFEYSINATDGTNYNKTEWIPISVIDNDSPTLILDHSDLYARNGMSFSLDFEIKDNIAIDESWCWIFIDENSFHNITLFNDVESFYSNTFTIPIAANTLEYSVFSIDFSNNLLEVNSTKIVIKDAITPTLIRDDSSPIGYTGDPYTFNIVVEDNIGVKSVVSTYWFGSGIPTEISLQRKDTFTNEIIIPSNSLDPLHYQINMEDVNGNKISSDTITVDIVDNDKPEFIDISYKDEIGNGEMMEINLNITENIELVRVSIESRLNGKLWSWYNITKKEEMNKWIFYTPVNLIGKLSFQIIAEDSTSNMNSTKEYFFYVIDTIKPSINSIDNITVKKGQLLIIEIEASDNIEVEEIEWIGLDNSPNNFVWEGRLTEKGDFNISVIVRDTSGNQAKTFFVIIVEDNNEKSNINMIRIVIISTLLLLILIPILVLILRRYKKQIMEQNSNDYLMMPTQTPEKIIQEMNN